MKDAKSWKIIPRFGTSEHFENRKIISSMIDGNREYEDIDLDDIFGMEESNKSRSFYSQR